MLNHVVLGVLHAVIQGVIRRALYSNDDIS
jgi:hypothetical protein